MTNIKTLVSLIEEALCLKEEIFCYEIQSADLISTLETHIDGYFVYAGATKLVLNPIESTTTESFVIKIPFRGFNHWEEFQYGNHHKKNCWDYCLNEMVLYKKAKAEKLHMFFLKNREVAKLGDTPIYVQQKAAPILDSSVSSLKNNQQRAKDMAKAMGVELDLNWCGVAIERYGASTFQKLLEFINTYSINDLHMGNLGYLNGKPIIFDYGGFLD